MLKILYCNWCLLSRSGTEIVTLETVLALHRRGHKVAVLLQYSGKQIDPLIQAGIPVITSLDELPWQPDIIHSNHLPQSLVCALTTPHVPQIFVCHDSDASHSVPPKLPCILRYCAVDQVCEERSRAASQHVLILPNAVDLAKFRPRPKLPPKPIRALLLGKRLEHAPAVQEACERLNIPLDIVGTHVGNEIDNLADHLLNYDLIFAVARNALESMAVGCAVVVVDGRGLAGMVRSSDVDQWRTHNFGKRLLTRPPTVDALVQEISRYDPDDSRVVGARIREIASLDEYILSLERVYESAVSESKLKPIDVHSVIHACLYVFCASIPDLLELMPMNEMRKAAALLPAEFQSLWQELSGLHPQVRECHSEIARLQSELRLLQDQIRDTQNARLIPLVKWSLIPDFLRQQTKNRKANELLP